MQTLAVSAVKAGQGHVELEWVVVQLGVEFSLSSMSIAVRFAHLKQWPARFVDEPRRLC